MQTLVQFRQGFAYFNNNVDSKRHIIIRTAMLYIYIYIYIYIIVQTREFSEDRVLNIVNVELQQVKLH